MIKEISSSANPLIKELRAIASSKKARQESGTFMIEGLRGIESLIAAPGNRFSIEKLIVTTDKKEDPVLSRCAQQPHPPEIIALPDFIFEKISSVRNAQGIMGIVRHTPAPFKINQESGLYLLLDSIRDPGNLGTLIRSAAGAGFAAVLLHGDCVELFNPKTVRSTMGTIGAISVYPVDRKQIDALQESGYRLAATTGREGKNLYNTAFPDKTILAIGSEAHGLSADLMDAADIKVTIPIEPACESLNAAIAGSICMFQIKNEISHKNNF